MRQAYRILPVYTGDVSGVCSALFELGGMVVIHDPSGCNSTYNTHDEVRWYDQDSLIFISGLTDVDAIMGDDERLARDVVEAVRQTDPRFVALVNSPIPYQVGCDFAAIAREVEEATGTPTRHLATNGMHDYVHGAGIAFEALADFAVADPAGEKDPFAAGRAACEGGRRPVANVLGMTPLDFAAPGSRDSVARFVDGAGFSLGAVWAEGSSLEEVAASASADLNLVVSSTALAAARRLRERFGTPYVVGLPTRGFSGELARQMAASAADGRCRDACLDYRRAMAAARAAGAAAGPGGADAGAPDVALVGEPVQMCSLAASLAAAGIASSVVSPLEDTAGLVDEGLGDEAVWGEEEVERALAGAATVVGDPFFSLLCEGAGFVRMPHLALSGRQWLHEVPNLMEVDLAAKLAAAVPAAEALSAAGAGASAAAAGRPAGDGGPAVTEPQPRGKRLATGVPEDGTTLGRPSEGEGHES